MDQEKIIPISETDVERSLKAMRNRKADGVSGILPELLKYEGVQVTEELTKKFNKIMEEQIIL